MQLKTLDIVCSREELGRIPEGKVLINTINAHSYNVALKDADFAEALQKGDYLIPDGASIVKACRWIKAKSQPKERIAGWDLFIHEMERLSLKADAEFQAPSSNLPDGLPEGGSLPMGEGGGRGSQGSLPMGEGGERGSVVMFMGSSEHVLQLIRDRCAKDYPNLRVVTYSPPYKPEFSENDNRQIIEAINQADPDLLWIGMTAPKQEKWTYRHWDALNIHCHVGTIGAVFDFYAGTVKRAPLWWQNHSLEWLYRLLKEPRRMWRRYIIGNVKFLRNIMVVG